MTKSENSEPFLPSVSPSLLMHVHYHLYGCHTIVVLSWHVQEVVVSFFLHSKLSWRVNVCIGNWKALETFRLGLFCVYIKSLYNTKYSLGSLWQTLKYTAVTHILVYKNVLKKKIRSFLLDRIQVAVFTYPKFLNSLNCGIGIDIGAPTRQGEEVVSKTATRIAYWNIL